MAEGIIVGRKDAQKAGNVVKIRERARQILTTSPAFYAFFLPTIMLSTIYKA